MNDCILFEGYLDRYGYGNKRHGKKIWLAHRLAWALAHGDIPEGMVIMHLCDTPACVNLDHLRLGTHADNSRDRDSKSRGLKGRIFKEFCPRDHPYSEENTYTSPKGKRYCRECQRIRHRKSYKPLDITGSIL